MRRALILFVASLCWCAVASSAQDEPSLGDLARQVRLQKQQKDGQAKPSKPASSDAQTASASNDSTVQKPGHSLSNDDEGIHSSASGDSGHPPAKQGGNSEPAALNDRAEEVRSQIQSQKSSIADLKQQIESISSSIHYAGGNCVANCVQWNEQQKDKQDEVDRMKAQLDEQQKHLEEMQDTARKQGFGSSVYDPE